MDLIYHITALDWWNKFSKEDHYRSPTLSEEGFIHCSKLHQVDGVLKRYYTNEKDLVLLYIDSALLTSPSKFELGTNQEFFPHVYGVINRSAIVKIEEISS